MWQEVAVAARPHATSRHCSNANRWPKHWFAVLIEGKMQHSPKLMRRVPTRSIGSDRVRRQEPLCRAKSPSVQSNQTATNAAVRKVLNYGAFLTATLCTRVPPCWPLGACRSSALSQSRPHSPGRARARIARRAPRQGPFRTPVIAGRRRIRTHTRSILCAVPARAQRGQTLHAHIVLERRAWSAEAAQSRLLSTRVGITWGVFRAMILGRPNFLGRAAARGDADPLIQGGVR